jgi:asparagine synthase (glutamine-hydrolysing)
LFPGQDPLSRIQYIDFKTYLVDDILVKVDRASMANSLEVRVPLLDHHLVELVARMPSNLKLKGRESKYILKKLAADFLPAEVLKRPKMGFSMPVKEWLRGELRPVVEDCLLGSRFKDRGLFETKFVGQLWKRHQSGFCDFSRPLWALLMFDLWARNYLDG